MDQAAPLTLEGGTALAITVLALLLFLWNRYRADVVALVVLVAIVLSGILTPVQAIAGFAHEATVTVALMLVLAAGLLRTGAVAVLARGIARLAGQSETRLLVILIAVVLPPSAVINNTAAVAVLLGAVLPLGEAMHVTGAAGLLVLTTILTSIISNAAAGAVLAPIAVAIAAAMGWSPLPFVIGIMIGASNSFLSPVGYQTNTMIFAPGGYRFSDYLRVGGPLSVLVMLVATLVIPVFFPFR